MGILAAAGLALLGGTIPARADMTVVATVKTKSNDPDEKNEPGEYTQTSYYKGTKRRVEEKNKVRIADSATGKEYILDSAKKTYIIRPLPGSKPDASVVPPDAVAKKQAKQEERSPVTPVVTFEPIRKSRTIAGKKAQGVKYRIALRPPKTPAKPEKSEKKDEGDFPDLASALLNVMPSIEMSGEQWMTDEITLPPAFQDESLLPALLNGKAFEAGLTDADREKIRSQMNGLDLSGSIYIKVIFAKELKGKKDAPQDVEVRASRDVTSISEAPLDDALFVVPTDYTEVKMDGDAKDVESKE